MRQQTIHRRTGWRLTGILLILLGVILVTLAGLGRRNAPTLNNIAAIQNGALKLTGRQPSSLELNVKPMSQLPELPTGCEITDVVMLMHYRGVKIGLAELAKTIPYDDDPEAGFWGDPFTNTGYTMYPPGWRKTFEQKLGGFQDLSGKSISVLKATLVDKKPVVAWVNMHGFAAHAILLIGYQGDDFIYNDPYTGKGQQKMTTAEFWRLATSQNHRAMTD